MSLKKQSGRVQHDFMTGRVFQSVGYDNHGDFSDFEDDYQTLPPAPSDNTSKEKVEEDNTDYIEDPIEKRKLQTINIIGELLQEFCYFRKDDGVIKKSTIKAIKHITSEFSDIDWQNVCISDAHGNVRSIQELIIFTNSLEILKFFVEGNMIKVRTKDATERLIVTIAKTTKNVISPIIQYISDKVIEEQEKKIETLKSIAQNS